MDAMSSSFCVSPPTGEGNDMVKGEPTLSNEINVNFDMNTFSRGATRFSGVVHDSGHTIAGLTPLKAELRSVLAFKLQRA